MPGYVVFTGSHSDSYAHTFTGFCISVFGSPLATKRQVVHAHGWVIITLDPRS